MRPFLLLAILIGLASARWIRRVSPGYKKGLLACLFFLLFLLTDGSSTASQHWEGAPPTYLPVGLAVALLLYAGSVTAPLLFISAMVAAVVNYHRHIFGWCGMAGVAGLYAWYLGAAALLRGRWRIDPKLGRLLDVGRYILILLAAEFFSAITGMLTLLGDGLIRSSDAVATTVEWWASDAIAILTIAPFLMLYVVPTVDRWLHTPAETAARELSHRHSRAEFFEIAAQAGSVLLAIWLVFGSTPAARYQPLYLLFIPLVWVAVRCGVAGAALTVFGINAGLTAAAWVTQAPEGSLPRLQLAMIALGLTGLCLGAVVTEGKRAEQNLRTSEAGLQEAQRVARLGSWTLKLATGHITWTEELYRMFGFDPSLPAPRLQDQEGAFTAASWQRLNTEMEDTFRTGVPFELELEMFRLDGSTGWIFARGEPQRDISGDITSLCGIAQDITERKRAEQQVEFLAYYDALTGLPNRRLLQDRLEKAIAGARRRDDKLAVLFFDLDRFKVINDTLGHAVGDLLLQEVAQRLQKQTRDQDTVARVGGDEFVAVLNSIGGIRDVAAAAERIVRAIDSEFVIQGKSLKIGCSLGISIFPAHGDDTETLLKNADAALYGAKENGRNQFHFFTEEMNAQVTERSTLEHALRHALERGELSLVYQPQLEIDSWKIVGLEALLRWRHPELGSIEPDKFIRVAETSGLIIPIGEWVLKTACVQARKWQAEGLPAVSIAVNVSALQFRQEGFRNLIKRVLYETGLAPDLLELELTESLLTTNADVMFSVMQDLKDMGVKMAIDDFGTGYSSLSYLRQFPVSKLKIDRSFIRDVGVSADAAAIATAVVNLAKSLHLKVIAEGVETDSQLAFLRARQCDEMQGYYFSPPLTVDKTEEMLRTGLYLGFMNPHRLPDGGATQVRSDFGGFRARTHLPRA